jgi:hypothetical protein
MQISSGMQKPPGVTAEERASNELVKRIRKLRWIGMEEEAERMQIVPRRVQPADTALTDPCDTA